MGIGNSKAMPLEAIHEGRHDSRRYELSNHLAIFNTALVEFKNSLSGDGTAFHPCYFRELNYFPAAVAQTCKLDNDVQA
jgi:hypothetical protein